MKIYRICDVSKSAIHDDEFVDIVKYINTYARRGWRCCQIFCGYILEGSQEPRFVSKKRAIRHGAGIYVRIPHYRKVYFKYSAYSDRYFLIIKNKGVYIFYTIVFLNEPTNQSIVRLIGEI